MTEEEARKNVLEKFKEDLREATEDLEKVTEIRDLIHVLGNLANLQESIFAMLATQLKTVKDGEEFIRNGFKFLERETLTRYTEAVSFLNGRQAYMN